MFKGALWAKLCATVVVGSLGASLAMAQSATGMAGGQAADTESIAHQEILNAAQAAEEAIKGKVTNKASVRGASGAIATLITSSDTSICFLWIATFRKRLERMATDSLIDNDPDEETLQAMQTLFNRIVAACDPILNPPPGGDPPPEEDEDAQEDPTEEAAPVRYTYPACPQCEPKVRTLDRKKYEYEIAESRLDAAIRQLELIESIWNDATRSPDQKMTDSGGETVGMAEGDASLAGDALGEATWALEDAQAELDKCLQICSEARERHTLLRNPLIYGAAGAAAVGIALAAGGGDPDNTGTPVTSADLGQNGNGTAFCGGRYNAFFDVSSDLGPHAEFVGMPSIMIFDVRIASIHITAPAPFVPVDGPIDNDGSFSATGMGTVAFFPNVAVEMRGTVTGCTEISGTLTATYSMGVSGGLPGGQPITFSIRATK